MSARPGADPSRYRLTVVVPAYGDAHRVGDSVARLRTALASVAADGGLEIVLVDDGSADGTAEAARAAGADQVIAHDHNRGKGAAVRTGMLAARGDTLAFIDVDLSYSPDQLLPLLTAVEAGSEMVVGSRLHGEAETVVQPRWSRRLASRLFNVLAFLVIGEYRDTQCGLKAFQADSARRLFGAATIDGFAFDVELFALARRWKIRAVDVPVSLTSDSTSSVHLRGELQAVLDLARIAVRQRRPRP